MLQPEARAHHASLLANEQTNRSLREIGIGALFWLGPITVSIVGLYLIGVRVDRVW